MAIIDGKALSLKIRDEIKSEVSALKERGVKVGLAVILVGNNPASEIYVRNKIKSTIDCGMESFAFNYDENVTEKELIDKICELNNDKDVNGILVQLPLPKHLDEQKILSYIDVRKDVDGFSAYQTGLLSLGTPDLVSCTPQGCIELIKSTGVEISGKNAVVIGRSNIVGKPVANLLLKNNATVTICHSKTQNIKDICKNADILVVAIGKSKFVTKEFVKEGAIVIDVGINRDADGKLSGDVDFDDVKDICSFITPVPGGVGPMTITMLLRNTLKSAKNNLK